MPDIATSLVQKLPTYVSLLLEEPRRDFHLETDWLNGSCGGHDFPVVYAIWESKDATAPLYVGETVGMGPRLCTHFKSPGWRKTPRFVSYLSHPDFEEGWIRLLAERFLICVLKPEDNCPWK